MVSSEAHIDPEDAERVAGDGRSVAADREHHGVKTRTRAFESGARTFSASTRTPTMG
jgi:hypothetical protein